MRDNLNGVMFGKEHILLQRLQFMNYLWIYCFKKSPTPIPLFVRKGTFSKSNMMNKIWFRKVKYKCSHIIVGKCQLMSWSFVPVNLFFYGIHVLQIQSEFIIYILITFIMIFFYSLIYLNNLISNSCINRFEFKKKPRKIFSCFPYRY